MFIEPTITWVSSGFSGYIWLDTKIVLKKRSYLFNLFIGQAFTSVQPLAYLYKKRHLKIWHRINYKEYKNIKKGNCT